MTETRTFTQSDLRTAVAVALHRDRARIAAIMSTPEAVGREQQSVTIATTTDLTVEAARAKLASAPKAPAAAEDADTAIDAKPVSSDPPVVNSAPAGGTADAAAMWERSMAARGLPMQETPAAHDVSALWDRSLKSRGMTIGDE